MESVEPLSFLVVMAILVAIWLVIGIRDRRRLRQYEARMIVERHRLYRRLGRCGAIWFDADIHWCDRGYEHVGPHIDTPTGHIRREHESLVGGPGISLPPAR